MKINLENYSLTELAQLFVETNLEIDPSSYKRLASWLQELWCYRRADDEIKIALAKVIDTRGW